MNKILTEKQAKALWAKLHLKYGLEIENLAKMSQRDMLVFGAVQEKTDEFRKQLIAKIESEK